MQTLDVQKEMQPVQYTEAVQSSHSDKKTAKEPDRKGASFLEMIKKLTAEDGEAQRIAQNTENGKRAQPVQYEKNAAAAQTELSRFKIKGVQKKSVVQGVQTEHSVKDDAPVQTVSEMYAVSGADHSVDVKKALYGTGAEGQKKSFEKDTISDTERLLLLAENTDGFKKQKYDKPVSGHEGAVQDALRTRLLDDDTKEPTEEPSASGKSVKVHHAKQAKPVFTVIDERTAQFAPVAADGSVYETGAAVRTETTASVDMIMDFRGWPASVTAQAEGCLFAKESGGQTFSALVAQQVQDMSSDFVQAGKIILQDNNAGLIRLQLQPAHLGNVRINLELAGDKKIVGKIITGSKEAYQAFKESIDQLAEAFEQGGFSSAEFDVSWSGESSGQHFAEGDSSFTESFLQNEQVEVMQGNHYADTQTVYSFGHDQAVSVFA